MKDINKLKQDQERLEKRLLITRNRIAAVERLDEKAKFRIYGAAVLKAEKDGLIFKLAMETILERYVASPKDRKLIGLSAATPDKASSLEEQP